MQNIDLSGLVAAAARLQTQWEESGIEFCFIGGLAVCRWGQPRHTSDVDATVWTDFGEERPIIKQLLQTLKGRIEHADEFAMINRVLLAEESQGVDVDVSLAAFPFERNLINRASLQAYEQTQLKICGPNDLVILKAFANRPRDWDDIRGVLIRSESLLDWELIETELTLLANLKEEPEIITRLSELRSSTG